MTQLRELLRRERLSAYIFPSTDPHHSEYVADHWKGREWISGFDGSAGIAVVTLERAALWTDSRYFLAAESQLAGTEYALMKEKMPGTPTIAEWLGEALRDAPWHEIGVDGMVNGCGLVEHLKQEMRQRGGFSVRTNWDPLSVIWADRPPLPMNPVEIHPLEYAGETAASKLRRTRAALRSSHADGMLVSALDDIAWLLNLRGTDVHCNPVFISYLLISTSSATLYIDRQKLTPAVKSYLEENGITTDDYANVAKQHPARRARYQLYVGRSIEEAPYGEGSLARGRDESPQERGRDGGIPPRDDKRRRGDGEVPEVVEARRGGGPPWRREGKPRCP